MKVKVAAVQYALKDINDSSAFTEQVEKYVKLAAEHQPQFLLFPELFTTQLLSTARKEPYQAIRELHRFTEVYLTLFQNLSRTYGIHIIGGTHIVREKPDVYVNRAHLFYPDGKIAHQDKIHLTPSEKHSWRITPGDELLVFPTNWGEVAILTCYDIEFPELSRRAMQLGARIIFCPSCTDTRQGMYRVRRCSQARAIENQLYVIETGTVGQLENVANMEHSVSRAGVFAPCDAPFPDGGIIAEGIENADMIIFAELDLGAIEEIRQIGAVPLLLDIRNDLYQVTFTQNQKNVSSP